MPRAGEYGRKRYNTKRYIYLYLSFINMALLIWQYALILFLYLYGEIEWTSLPDLREPQLSTPQKKIRFCCVIILFVLMC